MIETTTPRSPAISKVSVYTAGVVIEDAADTVPSDAIPATVSVGVVPSVWGSDNAPCLVIVAATVLVSPSMNWNTPPVVLPTPALV